ncbi:hypothetical protein HGRIS_014414 [Hohenbuehelia grisea]|uniref:DUF6534 domain-containing protein n=1 Tax=Hohenbuehelia grisea TaxID=104357 RepID=A0ABR3JTA9_9AGAR
MASHVSYTLSIARWGDAFALLEPPISLAVCFCLAPTIMPLVESFYLLRVLKLSGKKVAVYFGLLLVWLRYSGWMIFFVQYMKLGLASGALVSEWSWLPISLLSIGTAVNALISIFMAHLLSKHRDESVFARTTDLINRLIFWTLQTGFLTSVAYLVALIIYITMRHDLVWTGVFACIGKVFSNCLFATLNARTRLHQPNQSCRSFQESTVQLNTSIVTQGVSLNPRAEVRCLLD